MILLFLINLWRRSRNAWRRLLRRRVDWVRLEVGGALPEFAAQPAWWRRRFLGEAVPLSLQGLRRRLERVADAPDTLGVLLVVRDLAAGWATLQSLHEALATLRAAGKRVVAYLPAADTRTYFAACAADTIVMPPTAYLNLLGVRAEAQFLADALRLAGLEAELVAVSPYKSGGDQLARAAISPEAREQIERLVDQRYALVVAMASAARRLPADEVRRLIDAAPLLATAARDAGLIDAALYEDELEEYLRGQPGDQARPDTKLAILEWGTATRRLPLPMLRRDRRHIGVVSVSGAIAAGPARRSPLPLPLIGGELAGSDSVAQALRQAERDKRLAALVLHIDSPGGDSFASDLIWREVERVARGRPVVVSMGDAAASGGYYIAAPARAIIAQPATITGSIGVYALRPNITGLLERAEVGTAVIARGAHSGLYSPLQRLKAEERAALERTVAEIYAAFKERVCSGRQLSDAQLEPIAGGRVWTGAEAIGLGLVDQLGGLPAAVAKARALGGLPDDPRAPLILYRGGRGQLPPRPFSAPPTGLLDIPALLAELSRPRILAALPWVLREE